MNLLFTLAFAAVALGAPAPRVVPQGPVAAPVYPEKSYKASDPNKWIEEFGISVNQERNLVAEREHYISLEKRSVFEEIPNLLTETGKYRGQISGDTGG